MTFAINAWLDRKNPFIELRNTRTGELMAQFAGERLRRCIEQGDICLQELCKADVATQQELVRCLLLAHCSHCLQTELDHGFNDCLEHNEQRTYHAANSNIFH